QVSAVTFHYYARTVAFDNEYNYLITSTVVHLHSSLLSVPDCFCSLFLFPFNTCLLLNKHREVVYSLCLHSDCDRPTIIFHTTFLYLISIGTRFTAHLARTWSKIIFLHMIARQPNNAIRCNIRCIFLFCLATYFVHFNKLMAQTSYQLPPNQPEQDACNALQLCGGSFYTPYSYTGTGKHLDLDETPCFIGPGGGEKNSVWLQVHVLQAGTIVFKLTPVSPADDYDFAVINATGKDCSALTSNDVIRCNYNSNIKGSNINGIIGLSDTSRTPYIQKGKFGYSFCEAVYAKNNEVFLIMI